MTGTREALALVLDYQAKAEDRLRAVRTLAASGDRSLIAPLIAELTRAQGPLKQELRDALNTLGAAAVLAADLGAKDQEQRLRAATLLAYVPEGEAFEPLLRALADPAAKVREYAASALSRYADHRAVEPLADLLARERDPDARGAAAQALGRIGGARAREVLGEALAREKDDFTRILVEEGLRRASSDPDRL